MISSYRPILYLLLSGVLFALLLATGCTTTEPAAGTEKTVAPAADVPYPAWYRAEGGMVESGGNYIVQAAALGTDSAAAVARAWEKARAGLEAGISQKIESARKKAVSGKSAVAGPKFLVALRNAESGISGEVQRSNAAARAIDGYSGYRGFVEVRISRAAVSELMARSLSAHSALWSSIEAHL